MGTGLFLISALGWLRMCGANMCIANGSRHLSGLACQFFVPGHYQNWWLHWLLIIKMSLSQIINLFCISMSRGLRFPKCHGSYPDDVCELQLYVTCLCHYWMALFVWIGLSLLFLTLNPKVETHECIFCFVADDVLLSNNRTSPARMLIQLLLLYYTKKKKKKSFQKKSISFHAIEVL